MPMMILVNFPRVLDRIIEICKEEQYTPKNTLLILKIMPRVLLLLPLIIMLNLIMNP